MTTFRPMRRKNQEVSKEECVRVLKTEGRGVLSLVLPDGYPYGVPVDFYYDEKNDLIYFHGAKKGQKIDAIKKNAKACFTVYHQEGKKEGDWAWNLTSVIAFGTVEILESTDEVMLKKLGMKYYPTEEEVDDEIKVGLSRVQMLVFHPAHMTGKTIHEK